jgi:hypothetical protein
MGSEFEPSGKKCRIRPTLQYEMPSYELASVQYLKLARYVDSLRAISSIELRINAFNLTSDRVSRFLQFFRDFA